MFWKAICCVFLLAIFLSTNNVEATCHDGWVGYHETCYLFVKIMETWPLAEAHCKALGADLVDIGSAEEEQFVQGQLVKISNGTQDYYWLSGTDIAGDGNWVWTPSYEPMTYSDWYPGQPDLTGEHCIVTMAEFNFQWHDAHCFHTAFFICHYHDDIIDTQVIG